MVVRLIAVHPSEGRNGELKHPGFRFRQVIAWIGTKVPDFGLKRRGAT